ncbi:MAG: hypothetical protein Q4F15_04810 [Bacillota bacterium]|nr:hypothetical protein [Bacillota bacterium]
MKARSLLPITLITLFLCSCGGTSSDFISASTSEEDSHQVSNANLSIRISDYELATWSDHQVNKLNVSSSYYLIVESDITLQASLLEFVYDEEAISIEFGHYDHSACDFRFMDFEFAIYTKDVTGDFTISIKDSPASVSFSISDLSVSYERMTYRNPLSIYDDDLQDGNLIVDSMAKYEEHSSFIGGLVRSYLPGFDPNEEYFSKYTLVYFQFGYDNCYEEFSKINGCYLLDDSFYLSIDIDVKRDTDTYWDFKYRSYIVRVDSSLAFSKAYVKYNNYFS